MSEHEKLETRAENTTNLYISSTYSSDRINSFYKKTRKKEKRSWNW
jgi:hypothetical protein